MIKDICDKIVKKDSIVSLDIETTGLNNNVDEILQIAIINGYGDKIFYSYIKPEVILCWPNAEAVNHISPRTVKNSPLFYEVSNEIYSILYNSELIIGYNIDKFDIPFLEKKIGKKILTNTFDVMVYFSNYLFREPRKRGGFKLQKLSTCCSHYGVVNKNAHDSFGDALVTLKCFYKMINYNDVSIKIV